MNEFELNPLYTAAKKLMLNFLYNGVNKMKIFRKLILGAVGFVIGVGCSFLFYQFVVSELDIDDTYKVIIFALAAVFLSLGYAVSSQLRCLTVLTFPEFWSRAGKRALQATVLILVLSGPVANIGENAEHVVHLVVCFKDLTINITLIGKELIMAPVYHLLLDIKTQETDHKTKYNLTALETIIKPLEEEIGDQRETDDLRDENDEMDKMLGHVERSQEFEAEQQALALMEHEEGHQESAGERIDRIYREKLASRCENIFTKGTDSCYVLFAEKHNECEKNVTEYLGWLLCWPFKLDLLCDLIGMFAQEKLCDITNVIPDGFGDSYLAIKNGIEDFSEKFKIKVDYHALAHLINIDSLKGTQEELLAAFERTRHLVEYFLDLLKKILTFTYLLMIFNALEYHGKYFERLSFDNHYITSYFMRIDDRRKFVEGRSSILPLKRFERGDFMTVFRLRLKGFEWTKFVFSLIMLLIQFLVVLVIYGFDYVFTRLLELVRKHVNITITQQGSHALEFGITGSGFVANLMRDIVKDVNVTKNIDVTHITQPCLPDPRRLDPSYINRTLIIFGVLIIIIYVEAFSLRTRHCIANFFYPRRSKQRIRWLYNQTLRNRTGQLVHLKERVLRNADEFYKKVVDWNFVLTCAEVWPRLCRCLTCFKAGRRKCVLCLEFGEYYRCPRCHFSYCYECWQDIDQRCLYDLARDDLHAQMYEEVPDEIARV